MSRRPTRPHRTHSPFPTTPRFRSYPQHPFFQPPILADARGDQPGLARCAPFGGDNHVEGDAIRPIEPLARPAGQPFAKHVDVTRHAHVLAISVLWRS